jgi:hypothetical protein
LTVITNFITMVEIYNRCYNHFNFLSVFSTFNFSKISFNSHTTSQPIPDISRNDKTYSKHKRVR